MASAFSHAIASVAIGSLNFQSKRDAKFWLIGAFCAVVPDADAIGFWMGVPYESMWGHRGITHSIVFALLLALIMVYLFYREDIKPRSKGLWALYLTFFAATLSHPILDAFTTGGLGVAFFSPFYNERFFFPWQVIKVSPISVTRFFSEKGIAVLKSEFVWVWIPSFLIVGLSTLFSKMRKTA